MFGNSLSQKNKELVDKGWVYEPMTSDSQTIKQWVTDPWPKVLKNQRISYELTMNLKNSGNWSKNLSWILTHQFFAGSFIKPDGFLKIFS